MKKIDESFEAFKSYMQMYDQYIKVDFSESDTRSKLIDKLLIDVLGWSEEDIKREGHAQSGYYDYKISTPGMVFLVEAKKQFASFVLPSNHKRTTINVLYKENKDVIDQIRGYAIDEGIQFGLITNGYQLILFKIYNTNGEPWKQNSALIFRDIEDIGNRFVEFYENLSKYSVVNNGGFRFTFPVVLIEAKTMISDIPENDKELIRNSESASLIPLVDSIFSSLFNGEREDDIEFVKQCFVENAETKKNKSEIERLFMDDAPLVKNIIPIVNTSNLAKEIVDEINYEGTPGITGYAPNPIIIIGTKGAGKTTFINHLFKYRIKSEELKNHYTTYIDCRILFEEDRNVDHQQLAKQILENIYSKYEEVSLHSSKVLTRVYIKQIKWNDESIWQWDKANNQSAYQNKLANFFEEAQKDTLKHLTLLSEYLLRERRKRLIVIIDNADQFNENVQKSLFLFSQSLTKSALCGTVLSLREGYYRRWQNSPPFDAYDSNVYHVTAPPYSEILTRRIDFSMDRVRQKEELFEFKTANGRTVSLSNEYILIFMNGVKDSIFALENSALLDFVKYTTYPNIREGLRVFRAFLKSGHTKVAEYIEREKQRSAESKTYQIIPVHEFIKSIALQNKRYYQSDSSIVYNLFLPPKESNDHFIKLYLLVELGRSLNTHTGNEAVVRNVEIINKFSLMGYKVAVINFALLNLIKGAMIDTDDQFSDIEKDELPDNYGISITLKGYYYLKFLYHRFLYLDLVFQDTPVFINENYEQLKETFPLSSKEGVRNFQMRKEFVRQFLSYLEQMEKKQPPQILAVYGKIIEDIKLKLLNEYTELN